jgi:hypothetical protein
MQIDLISPYHGGSHRAWAEGWQAASVHEIRIWGMPDRFWKWRMHGGGVTLARRWLAGRRNTERPDLLLFTDMCDVTTFLAVTRQESTGIPVVLYMHENQLTYPLPQDVRVGPMRRQRGERDHHYAFINYVSMLAADQIYFNSHYHRQSFFRALPNFLKHFPEYNELGSVAVLREKSGVLPVGIDLKRLDHGESTAQEPPLILWNQRWEYDKNPPPFSPYCSYWRRKGCRFAWPCADGATVGSRMRLGRAQQRWRTGLCISVTRMPRHTSVFCGRLM